MLIAQQPHRAGRGPIAAAARAAGYTRAAQPSGGVVDGPAAMRCHACGAERHVARVRSRRLDAPRRLLDHRGPGARPAGVRPGTRAAARRARVPRARATRPMPRRTIRRRLPRGAPSAPERLSGDELLAAATTALAARENEQAASWLRSFRERGATPDYRYWSLVGAKPTPAATRRRPSPRSSARSNCIPRPATTCAWRAWRVMPNGRCAGWNAPRRSTATMPIRRRSWGLPTRGRGSPRQGCAPSNAPRHWIRTT